MKKADFNLNNHKMKKKMMQCIYIAVEEDDHWVEAQSKRKRWNMTR